MHSAQDQRSAFICLPLVLLAVMQHVALLLLQCRW
jgi:hypothetical protein